MQKIYLSFTENTPMIDAIGYAKTRQVFCSLVELILYKIAATQHANAYFKSQFMSLNQHPIYALYLG
ncbi:hypothetical protein AAKU64_002184 [Undibacterium sp. GrIS 1.8]